MSCSCQQTPALPASCSLQPVCSLTSVPETGTAMLLWLAAASLQEVCVQVVHPASGGVQRFVPCKSTLDPPSLS